MDSVLIHKNFPTLHKEDSSVYLDTAATSLTPQCVIEAMDEYYRIYRANIHRGLYKEAVRASEMYEHARSVVATFIGAEAEEVIFTASATDASNKLILSLEQSGFLNEGDGVTATLMDHHAVLLPLQAVVKRKKLHLQYIPLGIENTLDYDQVDSKITNITKIVVLTLASNVLGTINDVTPVVRRAREVGAIVVVDATAAVGHVPFDVKELGVDVLFFSGHKMCGPTGIGVLFVSKRVQEKLQPCFVGGGIVEEVTVDGYRLIDRVERFEAGTPNIGGVIGLQRAIKYLGEVGLEAIQMHCESLVKYAQEKLEQIEGIRLFSASTSKNVGIVSFCFDTVHAHDVAEILARNNVAVRAGHHCAMPLHTALGVPATVRASFHLYTTEADVDVLLGGLQEVKRIFS